MVYVPNIIERRLSVSKCKLLDGIHKPGYGFCFGTLCHFQTFPACLVDPVNPTPVSRPPATQSIHTKVTNLISCRRINSYSTFRISPPFQQIISTREKKEIFAYVERAASYICTMMEQPCQNNSFYRCQPSMDNTDLRNWRKQKQEKIISISVIPKPPLFFFFFLFC
jgi:hypothetical protein